MVIDNSNFVIVVVTNNVANPATSVTTVAA